MKIKVEVTNKEMTFENDEIPPKKFVLPRDLFLAAYNAMLWAKKLRDGEKHLAELKTQSELIPPEAEKPKKKSLVEKVMGVQAAARQIANGMESVSGTVTPRQR